MRAVAQSLLKDVSFYHQLYYPGQDKSVASQLVRLLRSRGLFLLAVHRMAHAYTQTRQEGLLGWVIGISIRIGTYISEVRTKSDILPSTMIEQGVYLSDQGHIIMGARSIGKGTLIHSRVTIGMNLMDRGIPEIGRNVWIGDRCVIFGNIKIGDGVTVLPNTVLSKSVPSNVVVQGNPALIIKRNFDNASLRKSLDIDIRSLLSIDNSVR